MLNRQEVIEYIKCAKDPVYFLENYGYIYNVMKERVDRLSFDGFEYQVDMLRKFQKHRNNVVLKSRQLGLSVISAGFVVWTLLFKIDQRILIVANDGAGAIRFLDTVKQYLSFISSEAPFLFNAEKDEKSNNLKEIVLNNGNWVRAVASSKNAGRGYALTMLILDETAFIDYAEDIWMAAGIALTGTGGKCIMISTPQGINNLYHKTWVNSSRKKKEADTEGREISPEDFYPTTIHWKEHPKYSKGLEERYDEFGRKYYWSPWYEAECERLQHDSVKIAQELDLSFEGSKAVVFPSQIIDKYNQDIEENKYGPTCYYTHSTEGSGFVDEVSPFWVFKKPELNANYIVSVDVARGDGADYSTIQVINPAGGPKGDMVEQVAEFQGKIPADVFAQLIYKVAMEYNRAYVVIECNNVGLATALTLKNSLKYDPRRIYHSKSIKKLINHHFNVSVDEEGEIPGFQTSHTTRPLLITGLGAYLRERKIILYSSRLINEFTTFVYDTQGRPGHQPGAHDDLIFALAIGLFIRDREFENVFLNKEFYKAMLSAISYSNTNSPLTETQHEKFKTRSSEQFKIPDTSNLEITDDNDLRWLYNDIPKKKDNIPSGPGDIISG